MWLIFWHSCAPFFCWEFLSWTQCMMTSKFIWPNINSVRASTCLQCQKSKVHHHISVPFLNFFDTWFSLRQDSHWPGWTLPTSTGNVYLLTLYGPIYSLAWSSPNSWLHCCKSRLHLPTNQDCKVLCAFYRNHGQGKTRLFTYVQHLITQYQNVFIDNSSNL